MHGLRFSAIGRGNFFVVGGSRLLFMCLDCLIWAKVMLLVCVLHVLCIGLDLICLFRIVSPLYVLFVRAKCVFCP